MPTKKPLSDIGRKSKGEGNTSVHASRQQRITRASSILRSEGGEKKIEVETRRAMSILKPYEASLKSPSTKLIAIKKGLDAQAINDLIEISGATQMDLARILDLTEPTLRKHIKLGKHLNTGLSEHILQLFHLFDKGMDTFGSLEEFKSWLWRESIALSTRPADVLDTITGINMVIDELIRIDYGITV